MVYVTVTVVQTSHWPQWWLQSRRECDHNPFCHTGLLPYSCLFRANLKFNLLETFFNFFKRHFILKLFQIFLHSRKETEKLDDYFLDLVKEVFLPLFQLWANADLCNQCMSLTCNGFTLATVDTVIITPILPHSPLESWAFTVTQILENCLVKLTSKSTSGRKLHPQNGPWIFRTGSMCSFATMNFGENGCHCCITYPTVLPGGDCTSSWVRDCGRTKMHDVSAETLLWHTC